MANSKSIQVFLEQVKEEQNIITSLAASLGFSIESIDFVITDAIGFSQVTHYSQGYPQGILVTWPADVKPQLDASVVIAKLAIELNVSILLEPSETSEFWLQAQPDGSITNRRVIYLDDGIDVTPSD